MKYLLIDGNNLAIRNAFTHQGMQNTLGMPSGFHYGFFQSLISLKKDFHEHQMLIAWDSSSKRRKTESKVAVEAGLIKSAYKDNRKKDKDETPIALQEFFDHGYMLQQAIGQTGIPQILVEGFEADDVIASYVEILSADSNNEVVLVTSDKDYLQLIKENVWIWDGMKNEKIDLETFREEYNLSPQQMIDVGALMGDTGDNIFGVPGCGIKGAIKEIQKHGSWEETLAFYKNKYKDDIEKYGETSKEDFTENVLNVKTKSGKNKYPEVSWNMPHSGLLSALEQKLIKASKAEIMILVFEKRIELAYSLKKMDMDIPVPSIEAQPTNKNNFEEYLKFFDIKTLDYEVLF